MTGKMIIHIVMIAMAYSFLIWMIVRKRKLLESDALLLTKTEMWLLIGGIVLIFANGIMLIVDFQLAAGRSMAVSIMVGCIVCFLLAFFPPNNRLMAYLFELFVENSKRK